MNVGLHAIGSESSADKLGPAHRVVFFIVLTLFAQLLQKIASELASGLWSYVDSKYLSPVYLIWLMPHTAK